MNRKELARKIYDISYLRGEFKLRSGTTSNEYFDKYRFESRPEILREIAKQMAPNIPTGTEILAGLELGGVPVATALSLETGIPVVFVRKKAKDYGTCQFAEGLEVKGKKVCIIEDVITTGGQVVLSTEDLRSLGAQITDVLCVIHRGATATEPKLDEIKLKMTPLFRMEELKSSSL
jgi:orotate phosphoribosyltransferase